MFKGGLSIIFSLFWFVIGFTAFEDDSMGRYICIGIGVLCIILGIVILANPWNRVMGF